MATGAELRQYVVHTHIQNIPKGVQLWTSLLAITIGTPPSLPQGPLKCVKNRNNAGTEKIFRAVDGR